MAHSNPQAARIDERHHEGDSYWSPVAGIAFCGNFNSFPKYDRTLFQYQPLHAECANLFDTQGKTGRLSCLAPSQGRVQVLCYRQVFSRSMQQYITWVITLRLECPSSGNELWRFVRFDVRSFNDANLVVLFYELSGKNLSKN